MGKGKRPAEEAVTVPQKKQVDSKGKAKNEDIKMKDEDDEIEFADEYDEFEGSEDEWEDEMVEEDEEEEGEEEENEEEKEYWKQSSSGVKFSTVDDEGDEESDDGEEDEDTGPKQVWRPGKDALEEGEELDYDPTTYNMLHSLGTQWPCLSFAFIPDNLGAFRTKYPHSLYLAAGTQAGQGDSNSVIIMKVSRMQKTIADDSDSEEEESDDEEEEEEYEDPILETASLATPAVNKVKVMPQISKNSLIALWADTGKVMVFDVKKYLTAVDNGSSSLLPKKDIPKITISSHKNEGFSLDWSPHTPGRLLSGDCDKLIYQTDTYAGSTHGTPFNSHTASVEDIQWSPTESEVFASCSVDKTVKIWDSRATAMKAMITVKAHSSDVNSLSWNKKVPYLLATGSDDCSFKIWDLRNFKPEATVAHFTFHEKPISCVEWNPNDDSQLVVVSEDDQVTIWDMGLEPDDGEEPSEFPPQLFFVHQGQHEVKEAHWHPQIPNLIATTSADGFNMFITANSTEVAPPETTTST